MKKLFLLIAVAVISSCTTEVINHAPVTSEVYCTYTATEKTSGNSFTACIWCPKGASACGLSECKRYNDLTKQYDYYKLTTPSTGCVTCAAGTDFIWETK